MASIALATPAVAAQADTAATPNTVPIRDNLGGLAAVQMQGSELLSTGIVTLKTGAKTTGVTLAAGETIALCNATGGAFAVTLPPVATVPGRIYIVKKTDGSGNAVTVTGSGAETIDGANTKALSSQYKSVIIASDGTVWHILAVL